MQADESSSNDDRIAGLESQILNSQEIIARLNRELDSALLRITTLESVCSDNQTDLHEKRSRIQQLTDELIEQEEVNERLRDDIRSKESQIDFNRELHELVINELDSYNEESPELLLEQYRNHQRSKFHQLLQESLTTDDISSLIDSDDILFELLTRLNSFSRLKETLSRDSQQLQHIRTLLHVTPDHTDDIIQDLLTKKECLEHLRMKTDKNHEMTDMDLIKHVLHSYFNYQQQESDLKDITERYNEAMNMNAELLQQEKQIDELISTFDQQSNPLLGSPLDRLRMILQANRDHQQTLSIISMNEKLSDLKENLINLLKIDEQNETNQIDRISWHIQALIDFRENLSKKLSVSNDPESILQRINDYQRILTVLNSNENSWTDDTTEQLLVKLQTMNDSTNRMDDLQKQRDEAVDNETQLQADIEEIADEFSAKTHDDRKSNLTRIHQTLQSLNNFRQELFDRTQTKTDHDFLQLLSQYQQNQDNQIEIEKNHLDDLNEKYQSMIAKEEILEQSIERLTTRLGLFVDNGDNPDLPAKIDQVYQIIDKFCLDCCELTSMDMTQVGFIEMSKHIRVIAQEHNQIKQLIHEAGFHQSTDDFNVISQFQIYISKTQHLCKLICNDDVSIDQAIAQCQHDKTLIEKLSDFKQQLLHRLSPDDEEHVVERLNELYQANTDLKNKLQHVNDSASTMKKAIGEHEETLEKLRDQRERMLTKMKEIKTNNESLTDQLKQANESLSERYRMEIDYKNQIEQLEQQLRSVNNQLQTTLDECRTQQDLQDAMKLEITSIQQENDTQRKLYESRCRQIINEKNQLDKTRKELLEQKQSLEDENKHLQTILQTIQNTLENVDDINSIVDAILQLRQEHLSLTTELNRKHEEINRDNEKLVLNMQQQQHLLDECNRSKSEFEKRLLDDEQQLRNLQRELKNKIEQYEQLQNEYQTYREENSVKKAIDVPLTKSPEVILDIEQPSLQVFPVQQKVESNNWMTINIHDEEPSLTTMNKHSSISTSAALLNMFGELKSKLGITLTHRPRSSSINMPLVFREVTGDLFSVASNVSLAHCVSQDMSMSKGIATLFRNKFGKINELKSQNTSIGGCAYITAANRHVFYLVTKERYFYKPTMSSLESSLRAMRDLCIKNDIHQLAMPRIGCGLDKLNWDQVSRLIQRVFEEDDIEITIYSI
ncbi:unnamed protein product [Adineta ricciae]|uniref:Macro domain-containing protein n=1 Tax=Adineta ricciae TaxID=249248 RepID=A0A815MSR7_ADIRI|nr:unnamed protein product [Adineta ricciae]CAF1427285.1 unnamed protein product [Adineta ricciae]